MRDIAVVLVTIDRSPRPNYLADTLASLARSGVFTSERLHSFHIVDGGSEDPIHHVASSIPGREEVQLHYDKRVTANYNVASALRIGSAQGAPWVLFLEDDGKYCDRFLESVALWLEDHAQPSVPVYSFATNYRQVTEAAYHGETSWDYPVQCFYGTVAFACRPEVAESIAEWLEGHEFSRQSDGTCYDIHMMDWALEHDVPFFLAAAPSFVQHMGKVSSIRDPDGEFIQFDNFSGEKWFYTRVKRPAGGEI